MEKTTTIMNAMDRIKRHPLLQDIPFETCVDCLVDFIRIVGCPQMFIDKTAVLKVENYRAALPCDYVTMTQVRTADNNDNTKISTVYPGMRRHTAYRYASDSFFMSPDKPDVGRGGTDYTYRIQGNVIYTSTKDKDIEIAYKAIAVDDDGYPLLPDNPSFLRAFDAYIKKYWFTILFDLGKIQPAVLQQTLQDYAWAVGDCETEFHRLTLDKAETLFNTWNTLVVRANEHRQGFANAGVKEYLTLQP